MNSLDFISPVFVAFTSLMDGLLECADPGRALSCASSSFFLAALMSLMDGLCLIDNLAGSTARLLSSIFWVLRSRPSLSLVARSGHNVAYVA